MEDMADVLRQNKGDDLLESFACDVAYPTMQVNQQHLLNFTDVSYCELKAFASSSPATCGSVQEILWSSFKSRPENQWCTGPIRLTSSCCGKTFQER